MDNQSVQNPVSEAVPAPVEVPQQKPKPPVMYLVLSVFILLFLASTAFLFYQNMQLKNILTTYQTPVVSPTPSATADPTANWKTYTDEYLSLYSIRYPNNWFKLQKPYIDTEPMFSNYNSFQPTNNKDEIRFSITVYALDSLECQPIYNDGGCEGRFNREYALKDNTTKTSQLGQKGPTESTKITNLLVDGKPAVKSLSAITPTAINLTYQVQNQNNHYYLGFFFNNKESLDKNMDLCDQILSTFKFTK